MEEMIARWNDILKLLFKPNSDKPEKLPQRPKGTKEKHF